MKKFLLGILAGVLMAATVAVVLVFASIRAFSSRPSLPEAACLTLDIQGDLPELTSLEAPFPALAGQTPLTMPELYQALERASRDPRIKGVLLRPRGLQVGWAKLQEIRTGIAKVRRAGKPVHAWLVSPGMREYYLATAAERVSLSPEDLLDVKGLRIESIYLKGTLDKLGVQFEVEHVGKYKDAGDTFSRSSMSPETREVLDSVLNDTMQRVSEEIGTGRKRSGAEVRALFDEGPFLAPAAKSRGLVDELSFEKEAEERLLNAAKQKDQTWIPIRRYARSEDEGSGKAKRVALLVAQGDILRSPAAGAFGEDQTISPSRIRRLTKQIAGDPSIRGVIVRVDSPGGDAIASDEILHELRELRKRKPLVVSMSDVAASGGYYIAMTGDPVVAYPGTLTGSIGVIYGKANLKGLYDKLGVSKEILTRGKFADIDSDYRPLSPEGRRKLRESLEFIYAAFLQRVSEGRRRPVQEIDALAQGRVWLGSQALGNRLVDANGGLDNAIELLRPKAGIGTSDRVELTVYPRRRTFFEQLMSSEEDEPAQLPVAGQEILRKLSPGFLPLLQGGFLRAMPYRVEIR